MPDGEVNVSAPVKRAIVTGACGFIGRAVVSRLDARGARVRGLDLPGPAIDHRIRSADLTNASAACAEISAAVEELGDRPTVFHVAGLANARMCRADPSGAFAVNVTATANVLEACRSAGLSRIVFPSTALVYALPGRLPIDELAPFGPRSIYAASKIAAEALLAGYAADFGFSVDVARLGNVYGPGGPADSVVSTLLRQLLGGGRVQLKTLAPVRDFIHRDDVAEGLIRLAEAGSEPGLRMFNLSSGVPTSIAVLADLAARAAGRTLPAVETEPGTGRDDQLALDVARLAGRTGWTPAIPLSEGLRQTLKAIQEEER